MIGEWRINLGKAKQQETAGVYGIAGFKNHKVLDCKMMKTIPYLNQSIPYDLQYKNVKNINLRIKADGTVHVSASKRAPQKVIDAFLLSKAAYI